MRSKNNDDDTLDNEALLSKSNSCCFKRLQPHNQGQRHPSNGNSNSNGNELTVNSAPIPVSGIFEVPSAQAEEESGLGFTHTLVSHFFLISSL